MRLISLIFIISSLFLLAACGGGGSDGGSDSDSSDNTATGRFYPPIEGLRYQTASQDGITDKDGTFKFKEGGNETISFTVGGVRFDTTSTLSSEIITPVDLTGSKSGVEPNENVMRFLMMLDTDNNPANGISISSAVRTVAATWSQPDFNSGTFDTDIAQIIDDVRRADNRQAALPGMSVSITYLKSAIDCQSSGAFTGAFDNDDDKKALMFIYPELYAPAAQFFTGNTAKGVIDVLVYSESKSTGDLYNRTDEKRYVSGLVRNSDQAFGAGRDGDTGTLDISGNLDDNYYNVEAARWKVIKANPAETGTLTLNRLSHGGDALYRLTGRYSANPSQTPEGRHSGAIVLNVMKDNTVDGMMAAGVGAPFLLLSGQRNSRTITVTATIDSGYNFEPIKFDYDGTDSTNDSDIGTTEGFTGSFTRNNIRYDVVGHSCKLNPQHQEQVQR